MSRIGGVLLLAAAGVVLPMPIRAQAPPAKPSVQVIFHVEANRYIGHFGQNRAKVQDDAAKRFAAKLEENFGFLHFTISQAPIQLTVTLANGLADQHCMNNPDCSKATIFRLKLDQPGLQRAEDDSWVYLPANDYLTYLYDWQVEVANFEHVGFSKLDANHLVAILFSDIPLSPTARLFWQPSSGAVPTQQVVGLTVPLPATVLCVDQDSVLRLSSEFPDQFTTVKAELAVNAQGSFNPQNPPDATWNAEIGNLFGIPDEDPPKDRLWGKWAALNQSDRSKIHVNGVYMHAYRRLDKDSCSPIIAPEASGTGPGGGR
jgi:hypothetical protein